MPTRDIVFIKFFLIAFKIYHLISFQSWKFSVNLTYYRIENIIQNFLSVYFIFILMDTCAKSHAIYNTYRIVIKIYKIIYSYFHERIC